MFRSWPTAFALAVALLAVGCGDDDPAPALEVTTGKNAVESEIGVRGGVLELESRARITLPAGALDETIKIRAEVGDLKGLPDRPDEYEVIGEPLVVTPHGLKLERSATIEMGIDDEDSPQKDLRVLRLDDDKDRTWQEIDGVKLAKADEDSRFVGDLEVDRMRMEEDTITALRRVEFEVDTFSIFLPVRLVAIDRNCDGLVAGATCRSSAGDCDAAEVCDGKSSECPEDAFADAGTQCRTSAGLCDVADTCDGKGADCPEDGVRAEGAVCRPARDECDVAETCDGTTVACPQDAMMSECVGAANDPFLSGLPIHFSVASGASDGLPGTDVAGTDPAQGSVFSSTGRGIQHIEGPNTLETAAADLGLGASDDLDGISILHADYGEIWFSVADGATVGAQGTLVREQSDAGEVPGDIFQSFRVFSGVNCVDPPCTPGVNFLVAEEVRLGLQPVDEGSTPLDNINALEAADDGSDLYFSVTAASAGTPDTAVAMTAANERGCTVFTSARDGNNSVAFSCAELGLAAGDEIDALFVYNDQGTTSVHFSVAPGAVGTSGSAVNNESLGGLPMAAHVFASAGANTNTLLTTANILGLREADDIDALSRLTQLGAAPKFTSADSCSIPWGACGVSSGFQSECSLVDADRAYCRADSAANPGVYQNQYCAIDLAGCTVDSGASVDLANTRFPTLMPGNFFEQGFSFLDAADPPTAAFIYEDSPNVAFVAYRVTLDPASSNDFEMVTLTVPTDVDIYGQLYSSNAFSNGDTLTTCTDNTGGSSVVSLCRISYDWSGGTGAVTLLGPVPLPCLPCSATAVDPRNDGIDVVVSSAEQYVCQLDANLDFVEPMRSYRDPSAAGGSSHVYSGFSMLPSTAAISRFSDSGNSADIFYSYTP